LLPPSQISFFHFEEVSRKCQWFISLSTLLEHLETDKFNFVQVNTVSSCLEPNLVFNVVPLTDKKLTWTTLFTWFSDGRWVILSSFVGFCGLDLFGQIWKVRCMEVNSGEKDQGLF